MAAGGGPKPLDHLQADASPSGGGGGGGFSIEPARKKRGRPRKYSPDNSIGLGLSPAPVTQIPSLMAHNDSGGGGGGTPSSETPAKRNRGRPPGSVKRQLDALGSILIFLISSRVIYMCIYYDRHHEVSLLVSRSTRSWFYAPRNYGECRRGKD